MLDAEDFFGLESMFAMGAITLADVVKGYPTSVDKIARLDRLSLIAALASMLALPDLQANAYRIEAMIHVALTRATGSESPSSNAIAELFESFGKGFCGQNEDPAEDLFTTSVHCRIGNFIVLEGLREGNGFYLQRVLDVLEDVPDREPFQRVRRAVFALLTLSHAVAQRAGLVRGKMGEPLPQSTLSENVLERLGKARDWVRFSVYDPELLMIDFKDLSPFLYEPTEDMDSEPLTDSALERRPVLRFEDLICLALPTSIGAAITRYVLEEISALGKTKTFEAALMKKYWELLTWTPLAPLGMPSPIARNEENGLLLGSFLNEIDPGRYLHIVIAGQPLIGIETEGFSSPSTASIEVSHRTTAEVKNGAQLASKRDGFREGITLIVICGLGRANFFVGEVAPPNWHIEYLPIHDVITMARMEGFKPIDLFRMADSKAAVQAAGIKLSNCNGLLNLWAWAKSLEGHLIPHGELPEEFRGTDAPRIIVVKQNGLLDLRREVDAHNHSIVALNVERRWKSVQRHTESFFEDDVIAPLYFEEDGLRSADLSTVYVSDIHFWWLEATSASESRAQLIEHWKMLHLWLTRLVPVLEPVVGATLPAALKINVHFEKILDTARRAIVVPGPQELEDDFKTEIDRTTSMIHIRIGDAFDSALASPDNIAERALVVALVRAVCDLAGVTLARIEESALVQTICGSHHARSRHIIQAQTFRDMVSRGEDAPLLIHRMDDAIARVGVAFRAQSDVEGEVLGNENCTRFLNEAVELTLRELCVLLRTFNRRHFIAAVLNNHERAAIHRDHWRRTAHATIALHGQSALKTVAERMGEMNVCSIASRILIEAATCECPVAGGLVPGELDLSRAMARAIFAFNLGGWSDAVHWGAIAPRVVVTPIGDIHIDHSFMDAVYVPFSQGGGERDVLEAIESYKTPYSGVQAVPSIPKNIEPKFLEAWEAEFGVSIEAMKKFADRLETIGIERDALWFELDQSELTSILAIAAGRDPKDVAPTLALLTLPLRADWRSTPHGFRDKDWHPWRFRRRLSLARRPFILLSDGPDPRIVVAPGIVREALYILLRSSHNGETPDWHVSSSPMRKWLGHVNNVNRTAFNKSVSGDMVALGWKSDCDYRITRLLGFPLDKDYGDVDALAWDPESGRVLAIECKDLQFNKTLGEVAEQLSDFRGEQTPGGKRDLLRKHLDRLIVMEKHKAIITKRLHLKVEAVIEGYVVFKNPVPMKFAWPETQPSVKPLIASELETLRLNEEPSS
jgi:hypothetical protein